MTQFRCNIFAALLLFCSFSLSAQGREEVEADPLSKEISLQHGVMGSFRSSDESVFTGYNSNFEYAQFGDEHWGYRTGFSMIDSYPGCRMQYTIPIRVAYRTYTHQAIDSQLNFFTFEDFFVSLLTLFPWHVEFNGGIALGYAQSDEVNLNPLTQKSYQPDFYRVNNNVVLSLDLGMRYNIHLGHINLFIAPQFSYQPTRNYVFYSQNGTRKEYERAFFGGISAGIGLRY